MGPKVEHGNEVGLPHVVGPVFYSLIEIGHAGVGQEMVVEHEVGQHAVVGFVSEIALEVVTAPE